MINEDKFHAALEVLEDRLTWLKENAPEAKREIETIRDAIMSLLAWKADFDDKQKNLCSH